MYLENMSSAQTRSSSGRPASALTLTNFNPTRGLMSQVTVQSKLSKSLTSPIRPVSVSGGLPHQPQHHQIRGPFSDTTYSSSTHGRGGFASPKGPLITVEINRTPTPSKSASDSSNAGVALDDLEERDCGSFSTASQPRRLWSREDRTRASHQSQIAEVEADLQQRIDLRKRLPGHVELGVSGRGRITSSSLSGGSSVQHHQLPPRPSSVSTRLITTPQRAVFPVRHANDFSIQPQVRDLYGQLRPLTVIDSSVWKNNDDEEGLTTASSRDSFKISKMCLKPAVEKAPFAGDAPSSSLFTGDPPHSLARPEHQRQQTSEPIRDSLTLIIKNKIATTNIAALNRDNDGDASGAFLYGFEIDKIRRKQYRDLVRHQRKLRKEQPPITPLTAETSVVGEPPAPANEAGTTYKKLGRDDSEIPMRESDKLKQQILDLGGSLDENPLSFCTPRLRGNSTDHYHHISQYAHPVISNGYLHAAAVPKMDLLMMQGMTSSSTPYKVIAATNKVRQHQNGGNGDDDSNTSSELSDDSGDSENEYGSTTTRGLDHSFGNFSSYFIPGNDPIPGQSPRPLQQQEVGSYRRSSKIPDIFIQQFDVSGAAAADQQQGTSRGRKGSRRRSLIELAPSDMTSLSASPIPRRSLTPGSPSQHRRLSSAAASRRKSEDVSRTVSIGGRSLTSSGTKPLLPPGVHRTSSEQLDDAQYKKQRSRSDFFHSAPPNVAVESSVLVGGERTSRTSTRHSSPWNTPQHITPMQVPPRRISGGGGHGFLNVSHVFAGDASSGETVGYGFDAYNKADINSNSYSNENSDSYTESNSLGTSSTISDTEDFLLGTTRGGTAVPNNNNDLAMDVVRSVEEFFLEHDEGLVSQAQEADELLPLDGIPVESRVLRIFYKSSNAKSISATDSQNRGGLQKPKHLGSSSDPLDEDAHLSLKQIAVETLRREGNEKAAMVLEQQIHQEQSLLNEKRNNILKTLDEVMSFDCKTLVRYEGGEINPRRHIVTNENDTNMPPQELHLYQMYCNHTNTVIMFRPTSSAVPSMYAGNFFVPSEYCDESGIPRTVEEIPGNLCFEDVLKFTTSECRIKGKGIGVSLKSSPYAPIEGFIPLNPNLSKTYSEARKKERLLEDNLIRATDKISTALLKKIRSQRSMLGAATSVAMQEIVASMQDSDRRMEALLEEYRSEASLCVDKELVAINYISRINEAQFLGKTIATWRGMGLYYRHVPSANATAPKSKFVSEVREVTSEKPAGDEEVERNGDGVPIFYVKRGNHLFSYNPSSNELNDAAQHALAYATSNAAVVTSETTRGGTAHLGGGGGTEKYPFHVSAVKENLHPVLILTHRSFIISPMTKRIEADPLGDFIIGPDFDGFAHASKMPLEHLTNPTAYAHEFCEKTVQITNVPSMGLVTPLDKDHILEARLLSGWMQNHGYECCNTVKTQEISEGGHVVVLPTMEVRILHTFPDIVQFYREAWTRGYPMILNPNWKVVLDNETLLPISFGDELSMPIVGDCGSALVNHAVTSEGKTVSAVKAEATKYLVDLLAQKRGLGGARAHRSILFGQYHVTTQMAAVIAKKELAEKFYALRRWLLMPPHFLHLEVMTRKWLPAEDASVNHLESTRRKKAKKAIQLQVSHMHSSRISTLPRTMHAPELEPKENLGPSQSVQAATTSDSQDQHHNQLSSSGGGRQDDLHRDVSFIPCSAEFEEYRIRRMEPLLVAFEEGCEDFDLCFVDDCGRFTKMLKAYVDQFVQSPRGRELRNALDSTYLGGTTSSIDPRDAHSSNTVSPQGSHADLSVAKKMSSFSISTLRDIHNSTSQDGNTLAASDKDAFSVNPTQAEYINPFAGARRARSSGSGMLTATIEDPSSLHPSPSDANHSHAALNKRAGSQHQLQDAQMLSMSIRGGGSNAGMLFDKIRRVQMKQENRTDY